MLIRTIHFFILFFFSLTFQTWALPNRVTMYDEGDYRYMKSNGIPVHLLGKFPNSGNPNKVLEQSHWFRISMKPELSGTIMFYDNDFFGVALNGVPFDPKTAEYWNDNRFAGWNYEALSGKVNLGLDQHNAHAQPDGTYHYHGIPHGLVARLGVLPTKLVGYAGDGFPVFVLEGIKSSYRIKRGDRPSGPMGTYDGTYVEDYEFVPGTGDLDECNGRYGVAPGHPYGTYHYFITETFPFIPRCFKGTPDPSFHKVIPHSVGMKGRPFSHKGGRQRQPLQEAVKICKGKQLGQKCLFNAGHVFISGKCRQIHEDLACVP